MEDPLSIVVPAVVVILSIITVLGLYLWWSGGKSNQATTSDFPVNTAQQDPFGTASPTAFAEQQLAGQAGMTPVQQPFLPPTNPNLIEVMRLYRSKLDGALIIEMDGIQYRSLSDIRDQATGKRFLGNAHELAHIARVGELNLPPLSPEDLIPPQAGTYTPPPSPPPAPVQPVAPQQPAWQPTPPAPQPMASAPPPAPSSPPAKKQAEQDLTPLPDPQGILGGMFDSETRKIREELKQMEIAPPRSMQEEIEDILQEQLPSSPYATMDIHIHSSITGGIRIQVDNEYFDGIGDVPYDDIRTFLQSIVREWESRK